jgi:type I restriction enzyme S subunit
MAKPEIRLKGFEGEWKECSFSKVILVNSGKDYKHLKPGVIPVYGTGGYMLSVDRSISDKDAIGIGRKGTIDAPQLLKAPFWTIDTLFFMTVKDDYSLDFIYSLCQTINWRMHDESTGVPSLSKNNIEKIGVFVPDSLEQQAIADYFKSLNSMLQSTTKKIESLKQVKQACLVSMFPQAGETTPRVRFKGFEGEWKCVNFGSIITECFDKTTSEDEDVLLSSAIDGLYLNSELFSHFRGQSNIGYRKVKKNMLILSAQNLHLGNANVNLRFEHGIVSPAYKIYYIHDCNAELLSHWIKREETKDFFLNATTSGASVCRKNIVWDDLYKQKLFIPKEDKEQRMIASFFTCLDKQISMQEKRLEKLKQIKAACLDKMFV